MVNLSQFDLPWDKFVGFCLFTLNEELIYDKIVNTKSDFSTIYHLIDTSAKTRQELQQSGSLTLINDIFRVDYKLFFNIILSCMFKPDIDENIANEIINIVKNKMKEQLKDYGAIEKMEPASQTALVKKLGNLIAERASNQMKFEFYPSKKITFVVDKDIERDSFGRPRTAPSPSPSPTAVTQKVQEETPVSQAPPISPSATQTQPSPVTTKPSPAEVPSQEQVGNVEGLLEFIGFKTDKTEEKVEDHKVELTKQLLEETKKQAMQKLLSSVNKGLSQKTGVCLVSTGSDGVLETLTFGMSEKHATFVLGILSKYPEVVKQTLEQPGEEKTLDAGDGVVILEETESGMLVSITKEREEIPIIAKRLKVVKTLIDEFLKADF